MRKLADHYSFFDNVTQQEKAEVMFFKYLTRNQLSFLSFNVRFMRF